MSSEIELSVVMPCLNEADTLETCLVKAAAALAQGGIKGELIVADNGSTDGSIEIAESRQARVVHVEKKGYGHALMGGIAAARGKYVIMGDSDDSYDYAEIPRLLEKLRQGYELVQGSRLPSGGGTIMAGAMPWSHRHIGNPLFSLLVRWWFQAPIHDVYCGLRGFTKDLFEQLNLRCSGMEFATEMIIKATLLKARIGEVPITLHPDGRRQHKPHLRTLRDGWRTLRFFLMYSPRWLFWYPGLLLIGIGLVGYLLALPGRQYGGIRLDAHTLLFSSMLLLCGYQSIFFAIFTKAFAITEGLLPEDPRFRRLFTFLNLERGLLAGLAGLVAGVVLLAVAFWQWRATGFGDLNYAASMRWVIPGATLTVLGFQTILSGFFISILGLARK